MIRVYLSLGDRAYGYDVTGYENERSESGWYDYELVEPDDNN